MSSLALGSLGPMIPLPPVRPFVGSREGWGGADFATEDVRTAGRMELFRGEGTPRRRSDRCLGFGTLVWTVRPLRYGGSRHERPNPVASAPEPTSRR
jgi:hypothetical protein